MFLKRGDGQQISHASQNKYHYLHIHQLKYLTFLDLIEALQVQPCVHNNVTNMHRG